MEKNINDYARLVMKICRKFANTKLSEDDLYQESMIALLSAIKSFRPDAGAKFETYATRCIQNRLIDIVRKEAGKEQADILLETQAVTSFSLEDKFIIMEKNAAVKRILTDCTHIERAVFNSYCAGYSYDEMSKIFELPRKKIDNTIQKVKNKIKDAL